MTTDELRRKLAAVAPVVRFDNSGANPGDLWLNDYGDGGRYIGNIDEPLYADLIAAAVNALPALLAVAEAARETRAAGEALQDAWRNDSANYASYVPNYKAARARLDAALARLEAPDAHD